MMHPRRVVLLVAALFAIGAVACDGDNGGDDETSTPEASATAEMTATPVDIRTLSLEGLKPVQDLLTETGASLVQEDVLYADLTLDGADEAVVPASSGGTLGIVGYVVLTRDSDGVRELLRETPSGLSGGLALSISDDGKLVETRAAPGPDDPECCPGSLRQRTFAWDGNKLVIESDVTVANPDSGSKTPSP